MSTMQPPRWERASDALFIEEMITSAFHDFAPYAGADQQQLRLVRQQSDSTATTVVFEDNGDWSVNLTNPQVGSVGFTTTRNVALDLHAILPLRSFAKWIPISPDTPDPSLPHSGPGSPVAVSVPVAPARRFVPAAPLPLPPPPTLELLCSPWRDRHGIGLRAGPIALRATARSIAHASPSTTMSSRDITQLGSLRRVPFVLDGAGTIPFGMSGWHLSGALQCPMGTADGDTLGALCLHARRQRERIRLFVVQTLSTSSVLSETQGNWYECGTLVGVSVSLHDDLVRVSASSMIQDGSVDFEAAVVADATSIFTKPTLLKVGVNKLGRIGVGVATKVFDGLTVMLGIHRARGEDIRFGLELAF